ncbi:MAG: VanZ family protein [Bacteroidota bacterium]
MQNIPFKKFIPGIAWFFLILILIGLPGDDLPKMDTWFQRWNIDKLIHFTLFGILAYLFILPFKRSGITNKEKHQYFLRICFAVILWGLTTEFIQEYYVPHRSFDLLDWAADSLGAVLALFFAKKWQ